MTGTAPVPELPGLDDVPESDDAPGPAGVSDPADMPGPAGPAPVVPHGEDPAPAPPLIPYRSRLRRRLRRLAALLLTLFALATYASVGYNTATDHRATVPAGLTYLQTGDISTRYRAWLPATPAPTAAPIVLVHGFIESADTWQYLAPLLAAQGHPVYALDLVGWGYTQRTGPYDITRQAHQLTDFVTALHLDRPLLVGHSSGAAVAALATLDSPADVGGLMFLDGDGLATGAGQKTPLTHLFLNPYRTTLIRALLRSDTVVRAVYSATCGPACPRLDAAGLDQWRRPLEVRGAEDALWSMVNLGVAGLPPARLATLAALPLPKSVVFGGADSSYADDAPQTTAARIGAPPPTIIPGAAHLTSVNSPGAVAAAIAELAARAGK